MGESVTRDEIEQLVNGALPQEQVRRLLEMYPKDEDRFWKYLEVLQERVPFKDKILLRVSDHLFIVRTSEAKRVVKCDCGYEFGDQRINWKLSTLIYVRRTREEMGEIYKPREACPEPGWQEIREFYCPGCATQLAVEVVPPGYPLIFEILPDLDTFYREWLGTPLEDGGPEWFTDRTAEVTARWKREGESWTSR